ncbi:MAG: tryptophan halogenase [Pseudonocardiales bacterium]|nr:MAG: tryptophan halogenase [Pseudonocardiales bacterium]
MSISQVENVDVVVVGGGPAGATVSTLVARQGHRVLLVEKQKFPRYQIGESLLPSTIHGVCRILGVADELERAGFKRKRGGTFKWGASPEPWEFSFAVSPRLAGPTSFAYQVERSKFDSILLDNARRSGVDVREGHAVSEVLEENGRVVGVRYEDDDGQSREARARYVVDASGNGSRIHRVVGGKRNYSDFFRNIAVFGYFEGGGRLPAPKDGNIFSATFDEGWIWYIPLADNLTSVGAVVGRENAKEIQGDAAGAWRRMLKSCPEIHALLDGVDQVTQGQYAEVRVRKDYSYWKDRFWSPGMILVGDAACFVDPVFSSGVHLATYSALLAARSINSCLDGTLTEDRGFGEFEARYRREYGLFYEFLVSFYDMHHDQQSYFWEAKKITNCRGNELRAFVELVGGIVSGDASLVSSDAAVARLTTASAEFETAVQSLNDSGDLRNPIFEAKSIGAVLREGANLQGRAMFGEPIEPEAPLFTGGLVASKDGMHWTEPVGQRPAHRAR